MIGAGEFGLKLLLLDTCGPDGSLVLADTAVAPAVAGSATMPGRSSSERLMPELRTLMAGVGWSLRELAAVAVVSGPGSFTGVRVGVAAAMGLCEAAEVPLVMLSRLRVLANAVAAEGGVTHAVLEAGRGEFFYGRFVGEDDSDEALLTRERVLEAVGERERVVVCEEGAAAELAELQPMRVGVLRAEDALGLAMERVRARRFDEPAAGKDANYVRRTDLEVLGRLAAREAERRV